MTDENPPHPPLTAAEYTRHRTPWFDHYRDDLPLPGTGEMAGIKSIPEVSTNVGLELPDDKDEIKTALVVQYGNARRPEEIRAWGRA